MSILYPFLYTSFAIGLLTGVGNWACRILFVITGLKEKNKTENSASPAGWIIGALERLIISVGMIAHSWEILVAVIALKTVARFKEMDQQNFAEYFLVGSLFSIFWAFLITSIWLIYDRHYGVDIRSVIAILIELPKLDSVN